MTVTDLITKHEGLSLVVYRDSLGIPTIGVGHNLQANPLPNDLYEPDGSISEATAMEILQDDVTLVTNQLASVLPWTITLDPVRISVLIDMAFNMGINGLLGFKNTLEMVRTRDYSGAAQGMLESKWASQVGPRASEDSQMMLTGLWPG